MSAKDLEIDTSTLVKNPKKTFQHTHNDLLRKKAIPTIYCPGCGIGTTISAFLEAITKYVIFLMMIF